ncbi:MAG: T9SS type A sorting domain-containing protein [Candidatus Eisenbacteria bacterium]|nr:T9SS type A sorting domain-containing protein [Candidatus Eisenbacteria bacterium]
MDDKDFFLQRFTGTGATAPGWPVDGAPICQAPDERNSLEVVPDGLGGALLVWADYRDFYDDDIFAMRVQSDGTRYPGWPLDGMRVTDNTDLDDFPKLAADGLGGAYLCWDNYTGVDRTLVQHLTGDGLPAPGWPSGGRAIPSTANMFSPVITADGTGGAIVAWESGAHSIRALRFNVDGPVAVAVSLTSAEAQPGWVRLTWSAAAGPAIATVERRTTSSDWVTLASITADGTGRFVYEDRSVTPGMRYGYRLAYRDGAIPSHTVETWVDVPAPRFALGRLTPNPSAGDPLVSFSLSSSAPATLELFDLAGRVVDSYEVGSLGMGAHELRLGERSRLRTGVYTVRLRQGNQSATARAVIIR